MIVRLALAMGVVTLGFSMLLTAVPLFGAAAGLTPGAIGLLVALPALLPVLLGMRAGDRVGGAGARERWLRRGTAGMALAPAALAAAPQVAVMAVAQAWVGATQLLAVLSAQAIVAGASDEATLERDYAVYATALSVGRLIGPLGAGVTIDLLGFRATFAASALATALGAGLAATVAGAGRSRRDAQARQAASSDPIPPAAPAAPAAPTAVGSQADPLPAPQWSRNPWRGAGTLLARPGVRLAVLASVGVFVALAVRQAFLPVVLDDLGYSASTIGGIVSLGAAAAVAARPFTPWVARRLGGAPRTLVVVMMAVAVAVAGLGWARAAWTFALLSAATGAGVGVGLPLTIATVARHVAEEARGRALGLRLAANRAVQFVAPVVAGLIIGVSGFAAGFVAAAAVLAAAALAVSRLVPLSSAGAERR